MEEEYRSLKSKIYLTARYIKGILYGIDMKHKTYNPRVPKGLGKQNKIDQKDHKRVLKKLANILKVDGRVFTPSISEFYSKIGFAGGDVSRSYFGITFEGMLMPEDIALVTPVMKNNGYTLTNMIACTYREDLHQEGIAIRFHKDTNHGRGFYE